MGQPLDSKRIGQLLLYERLIDEGQLEHALAAQAQQSVYKPLGEVLKELGFISRRELRDILSKHRKQILLGDLLVSMGVISPDQLKQALSMRKNSRKRLGQILVELGFITRSHLVDAICTQLGVEGVHRKDANADRELLNKANVAFLRQKRIIPLKYDRISNVLTVLMEDPSDAETITDLKKMFTTETEPVMLRDATVAHLLDDILDVWRLAR